MLQVFAFSRVGVVLSDLYFIDPRPLAGQESPERGVRLEVRVVTPGELTGSIYAARPIEVGAPVWRADLLEDASGPPGSLDRAHHHPRFSGWEPGHRVFDEALSADPVAWVGAQLADLPGLLERAGMSDDVGLAADADPLAAAVPEISAALRRMLDQVIAGQLARPPEQDGLASARLSWL
jgi:hypothetical protein